MGTPDDSKPATQKADQAAPPEQHAGSDTAAESPTEGAGTTKPAEAAKATSDTAAKDTAANDTAAGDTAADTATEKASADSDPTSAEAKPKATPTRTRSRRPAAGTGSGAKAAEGKAASGRTAVLSSGSRRQVVTLVAGVAVLAVVLVAGLLLSGGIGGDSPTEATEKFFTAVQEGDGAAAQDVLCATFRSEFSQSNLTDSGMSGFEVTDEQTDGESATVGVTTTIENLGQSQSVDWEITLVDEDGFKVCGIDPVGGPGGVQ